MPGTGTILDSTIISMRPMDMTQPLRHGSGGTTTNFSTVPDDREIFKALHDCMKDVGKFRQYNYYLGTSCDTTKLRNKIQKLKERINRSFFHQRELIGNGAISTGLPKSGLAIRRFEKCLCFTLAAMNYYEDLLHKFSILLVYFPLATGDRTNVVNLGFEDSTINADDVSYENHENEENETNRYIELLNEIQGVQRLRDEIEQIDIYQLRHHATSYSKDFVENMHRYTAEVLTDDNIRKPKKRHRLTRCYYLNEDSATSFSMIHRRVNRREFLCSLVVILSVLIIVGIIIVIIVISKRAPAGQ
ncbi:unnamed protein product [Rotaria socialis]|uniref:Uncharacterized protein n=1 Tax=Rotaria socialis TaxID=392032 RepID=A0A818DTQ7_9BILA|nr:unnamed protein product [Rotaria socialis]CAF3447296.1 unnamed protein product [Rotaria socialis]CAF3459480.1 unnamed protein product [Rotaria socialis]CAF4257644.1 unnamed protein product [Rotaria socialis]CAF4280019.1 unnamed protein product [Rotaria socialis]